ncbi:MAG: T9SS type A sorting domain-containing protein [Cytophagaceae bacterium]|nr:T9SS type A sorting domain-containing protein [Cytophagaceae bacterium]
MKAKILLFLTVNVLGLHSFAQVYSREFTDDLNPGNANFMNWSYPWNALTSKATPSKPTLSQYQLALNAVGGTGVYDQCYAIQIESGGAAVTLNLTGQTKVYIRVKSSAALTLGVDLEDSGGDGTNSAPVTQSIPGDNVFRTYAFNINTLIDYQGDAVDPAAISNAILTFNKDVAPAFTGNVVFDWISFGNTPLGVRNADDLITDSRIYPNPANSEVIVDLNLSSPADVKITVSNILGKELAIISEGKMNSCEKKFDVSAFVPGVYTVNYFVDGVRARSELLVVR